MSRRDEILIRGQRAALVSLLPATQTMRAGGAKMSAIEQRLVDDFRQMSAISRDVMVRFFERQASHDREKRIAENKPKFQLIAGGTA